MRREGSPTTYALDIETVSQGLRANEYTDNKKYKLGNVKVKEKVDATLKKKQEEARTKHGLHWVTGKVCSVALADIYSDKKIVLYGYDEVEILTRLAEHLDGNKLIGKTFELFDAPFLVGRYMANNLPVPRSIKSESKLIYDVDKYFGFSASRSQGGALSAYAHGLGIAGKTASGNMVQGMYDTALDAKMNMDEVAEKAAWKELIDYNIADAMIVREMVRRYEGVNL